MANGLQALMVSGLVASFVIAIFLYPILEANNSQTYNANIDTTNLTSLDKLDDLKALSKNTQDRATQDSDVSTEESEASFFTNAFVLGKFIITGGPLSIVDGMVRDFVEVTNIPWEIYILFTALIFTVVTFALVRSVTGR